MLVITVYTAVQNDVFRIHLAHWNENQTGAQRNSLLINLHKVLHCISLQVGEVQTLGASSIYRSAKTCSTHWNLFSTCLTECQLINLTYYVQKRFPPPPVYLYFFSPSLFPLSLYLSTECINVRVFLCLQFLLLLSHLMWWVALNMAVLVITFRQKIIYHHLASSSIKSCLSKYGWSYKVCRVLICPLAIRYGKQFKKLQDIF